MSFKSVHCIQIYEHIFLYNRRPGKSPVPETEAGSAEKGGGPHPEEDRSRPQRDGEAGEICQSQRPITVLLQFTCNKQP